MGKATHDLNEQENIGNRREGGEQFDTDSRKGNDDKTIKTQEDPAKKESTDTNESKGNTGSGQRQDSN